MTFDEFMNEPKNMGIREYEKLIEDLHRAEKKVRNISINIDFCKDALDILTGEKDIDRAVKKQEELDKLLADKNKWVEKIDRINKAINFED